MVRMSTSRCTVPERPGGARPAMARRAGAGRAEKGLFSSAAIGRNRLVERGGRGTVSAPKLPGAAARRPSAAAQRQGHGVGARVARASQGPLAGLAVCGDRCDPAGPPPVWRELRAPQHSAQPRS